MEIRNEIEIFKTGDGQTEVAVTFEGDTAWLSQKQIVALFQSSKANISEHTKHIFEEGELDKAAVVRKFRTTASDGKSYNTDHYNLDLILSIGYRVNSKRGTQFRQWATQRLKDHLVQGYTVNQQRLAQLQQVVHLIQQSGASGALNVSEAKGLLEIIAAYTQSFVLLNQFDSHNLAAGELAETITYEITYAEALSAVAQLKQSLMEKGEASALFGNQKDNSFEGLLQSVVQTFGGVYLYPSIEEQAAHLLYFVIKNHPFSDGNKRIGAFLFIWFLEKNKHRFKTNGEVKINDNGLVALALLVAQSDPAEKDLMIQLIVNLINSR